MKASDLSAPRGLVENSGTTSDIRFPNPVTEKPPADFGSQPSGKNALSAMAKRSNMLQNKYHPGLCYDPDSNDFPQEFVIILPAFKTAV
jgi:hypothetical protein